MDTTLKKDHIDNIYNRYYIPTTDKMKMEIQQNEIWVSNVN